MTADAQPAAAGLPPTPPTMSQDNSLLSHTPSLGTPVNARSPPTPDPSPPRAAASHTTSPSTPHSAPARPHLFAYPSSRAESFTTAREDASSEPSPSRSTPVGTADTMAGAEEDQETPVHEVMPDREWDTDPMRNVTIRRKRTSKSSPEKLPGPSVALVETAPPSPSPRPRRTSGVRERVEASTNSPVTPSVENFAQSIGWPSEHKAAPEATEPEEPNKRNSTSSMGSARVEASILVTPPRQRRTLRHSGKNMAYRDGSPTPDRPARQRSKRDSSHHDDVPLHRLVHKKANLADRSKRFSSDSTSLRTDRNTSSPLSFRSRTIDSSAATLAHQQSLRNVLQPAADILSRSSSVTKYYHSELPYHRRIESAPENAPKATPSCVPRSYSQQSPPTSPRRAPVVTFQTPPVEHSPVHSPVPSLSSPRLLKRRQRSNVAGTRYHTDTDDALHRTPFENNRSESATQNVFPSAPIQDARPPVELSHGVRRLVAEHAVSREGAVVESNQVSTSLEQLSAPSPPPEYSFSPRIQQGSRSLRGRSGEQRRSSPSQGRTSSSPEVEIRPSLDRRSTDELSRRTPDWRRPSEDHSRVSFDRSTVCSEEHAGARHQYASTTPFSQFSDTPIEVSEATAVSIYPHNNHSLLVVQQGSRVNSFTPEPHLLTDSTYLLPHDYKETRSTPTPPFVDAIEDYDEHLEQQQQPTLSFEPSTPPMQIDLDRSGAVDSPLKNPRPPPEPPKIMFIPPTPAEELEQQLALGPPGPPKRSDSHPQRRLSLVQRARRYSDNLIPTIRSRLPNNRARYASDSHPSHKNPEIPTVNDEDGTLHPFWRPRGFWDGFDDDTDTESEDEGGLHPGGDTSDVETLPESPKRTTTLRRRLAGSIRGSGGFLIGNSLGVERAGTNRRRHHVTLPPNFRKPSFTSPPRRSLSSSPGGPKVLLQTPTMPHDGRVLKKRASRPSFDEQRSGTWREGKSLPGLKKYQVQYIGLSGVKDKIRNRRREKRREEIRRSIGSRYFVEGTGPNAS
ncbi:hypothetical protein BDU57DRAFT_516831 [Ampelomyces quisqualis]|uniref:Uncharacterized protein n=1 Tax=Ampelomyces quisqualis TaxID=50730 RepID=A0A6A5QP85_AMPQU|nr:hypothetical protein BDU57DRAFT_516831 [Ampelomyces quisqualis]